MAKKEQNLLTWQAKIYRHYPKNFGWYFTGLIIAILLIVFCLWQGDRFGAVSLAVLTVLVLWIGWQKPHTVTNRLSTLGLHQDQNFIPYTQFTRFWIVTEDRHNLVNLETTQYFNNLVTLELEDQNPDEVREVLIEYVAEDTEAGPTLTQRLSERLHF